MIRLTVHSIEHGPATVDQTLRLFREFPWSQELANSNRFDTPSPTLLLDDDDSQTKLAASIVDGPPQADQFEFLLVYVIPGRPHDVAYNSAGHGLSAVETALQAFHSGDAATLKQILRIETSN